MSVDSGQLRLISRVKQLLRLADELPSCTHNARTQTRYHPDGSKTIYALFSPSGRYQFAEGTPCSRLAPPSEWDRQMNGWTAALLYAILLYSRAGA